MPHKHQVGGSNPSPAIFWRWIVDIIFIFVASIIIGFFLTLIGHFLEHRSWKKATPQMMAEHRQYQRSLRRLKYLRKTYSETFLPWKKRQFSSNKEQNLRYIRKKKNDR